MKLFRTNGDFTAYALALGYNKTTTKGEQYASLGKWEADANYVVRSSVYGAELWRNFSRYNDALTEYKKLTREIRKTN